MKDECTEKEVDEIIRKEDYDCKDYDELWKDDYEGDVVNIKFLNFDDLNKDNSEEKNDAGISILDAVIEPKDMNRTHYLKVPLNDDISLRYFMAFDTKKNLIGKWVIKSHKDKKYSIIDKHGVELILKSHNLTLEVDYTEIMGMYTKLIDVDGAVKTVYRKIVISNGIIQQTL